MSDLIEALQIFRKYSDLHFPTHCEHDILYIMGVESQDVSLQDHNRLYELGFLLEDGGYVSVRFGAA